MPAFPDPATFTVVEWAEQGHVARAVLAYRFVNGRLYVRVVWEDSWQPAEDLADHIELAAYEQRLRAAGDPIDLMGIARQQAAAAAAEAAAAEAAAAAQAGAPRQTSA